MAELHATDEDKLEPHPRLQAMQEIARAREQEVRAEIDEGAGEHIELDDRAIPDDPADEIDEPIAEEPEEVQAEAPQPAKIKIKVDGKDLEVDEDEIRKAGIATLQKERAADQRLEEAARMRKAAEVEAARIAQLAQNYPQQMPAPSSDAPAPAEDVDAFAEAARQIQYGSESEATAALKGLVSQAARSGQSEQLTLQQVSDFLEFRDATRWASEQYGDLLGDPIMRAAFANKERDMRAAGDSRPYREMYEEIGTELRNWLAVKTTPVAEEKAPQTREERKARIVTIPTAAARQPAPPEEREPSTAELIDQMRRARQRR